MNLTIDLFCQSTIEIILRQVLISQLFHLCIHGSSTMIMYTTFIAENTYTHIIKVILSALLKTWIVAFLLKFLSLQVIARVIFITDSKRYDIQVGKLFVWLPLATHGKHLQDRLLRTVVAILCPSLALGYPDVFLFRVHRIVDVLAHELTRFNHLMWSERAAHHKRLVHPYQTFYPGINQQVVANTNLYRSRVIVIDKQNIKEGRVEYNVTMVRDKSITQAFVSWQSLLIKRDTVGFLADDIVHNRFHETQLEVERRFHSRKRQLQQSVAQ